MTGAASGATPSRPRALRALCRALDVLTAAARAAVVAIVAALLAIVATQFVDRYFRPLWGGVPADEYVKVGLIWLTFVGYGIAVRAGVSIRVDLIDHVVAPATRRWLYAAIDVAILVVLAVVLWKGARLYAISTGQLILGTDMTVAVPTLGMLLGLALTTLAVIERVLLRWFPEPEG